MWHLRGHCYLNQGLVYARAPEAVVWIKRGDAATSATQVVAYFESGEQDGVGGGAKTLATADGSVWFRQLESTAGLKTNLPPPAAPPADRPPIYQRGLQQFDGPRRRQIELAQFTEFAPVPGQVQPLPPGMRRWQIFSRSDSPHTARVEPLPNGETAIIIAGGVRVLVEGFSADGLPGALGPLGVVDLSTDRAVVWTSGAPGLGGANVQTGESPLEIYMEGNIEFRQGDRIVYADRMYYDVRRQVGVILDAELLTPLPAAEDYEYQGLVRLKASVIRQLDESNFAATDAAVTTSRLEEPAYEFRSSEILLEDRQTTVVDPLTGGPVFDSFGSPVVAHQQLAYAQGNTVRVRGVPVFYWPTIATDLTKPSFLIDRVRVGNDSVFGTQLMIDWDAFQLFGMRDPPQGTDWGISTDGLSERGFGHGTDVSYDREDFFGKIGPVQGQFDYWGIYDNGVDNLGLNRRMIVPEADYRFRLFGEHRQRFDGGWEATAEAGWTSDRTFLEQYYEQQWDDFRSPRTGVRLKRLANNRAFSIETNGQVNPFFTETQWLPRLDHYWLGQSLLGDRFTWYEHSQAAYANQNIATTPTNPTLQSQFELLPWEVDPMGDRISGKGERLATRQEIDLPFQLGPVKTVLYGLGEAARWGEALDGEPLNRLYGQAGVRASLPMWAAFPEVRNSLFNLNGMAHKVVFDAEFSYADANQNFDELPLYDQLDDTSTTEFRRRLLSPAIAPTITDFKFDPRSYAFRSGMQDWVTAPSTEIVDDLMALRTGVRQRWQTKRGGPATQHIVDWITLDMNATYFPKADRDNFGQEFGLLDYDLRWHVGDRFTILSDGAADLFGDGLKTVSGGVMLNRPTYGNAYAGFRSISGPINSDVVLGSVNYRLSPKWITSASAAVDLGATGNIGQTFSFTRIGESLLVTMGVNVDSSKDNVGFVFLVEPRFLPNLRMTSTTGIEVPPAGAFGLE